MNKTTRSDVLCSMLPPVTWWSTQFFGDEREQKCFATGSCLLSPTVWHYQWYLQFCWPVWRWSKLPIAPGEWKECEDIHVCREGLCTVLKITRSTWALWPLPLSVPLVQELRPGAGFHAPGMLWDLCVSISFCPRWDCLWGGQERWGCSVFNLFSLCLSPEIVRGTALSLQT